MRTFIQLRRLVRDVKNPKADRRAVDRFNSEALWAEGTLIRVTDVPAHDRGSAGDREVNWPHGWPMYPVRSNDPRYQLLMDASEEVPVDTFDRVHAAYAGRDDVHYRLILKALVVQGKVSLEDVVALLARHDDLYEEVGEGEDD